MAGLDRWLGKLGPAGMTVDSRAVADLTETPHIANVLQCREREGD